MALATSEWATLALVVTVFSLGLSVLGWPESRIGVALNLVILVVLLLGERAHWF